MEVAWLSSDNYVVTNQESVGQTLHSFKNRTINCMNKLFNKCITPGIITQKWKHSMVTALHKEKGDMNDSNKIRQLAVEGFPFSPQGPDTQKTSSNN